jgi:hypothetical protein
VRSQGCAGPLGAGAPDRRISELASIREPRGWGKDEEGEKNKGEGRRMGHGLTVGWVTDNKVRKENNKGIMDFLLFCLSGEAVLPNGPRKRLQLSKRIFSFIRAGTGAIFELYQTGPHLDVVNLKIRCIRILNFRFLVFWNGYAVEFTTYTMQVLWLVRRGNTSTF